MEFNQSEFDVRCEWGQQGVLQLAPLTMLLLLWMSSHSQLVLKLPPVEAQSFSLTGLLLCRHPLLSGFPFRDSPYSGSIYPQGAT
jgi:hypothetical protein